jgi:hypothetical protein
MRASLIVAFLLLAAGVSCSGKKTPAVTPGTESAGLPPVPEDLAPKVYYADARWNRSCEEVPSGQNNCMDLLRREARRGLVKNIRQSVSGTETETGGTTVHEGLTEEDLVFMRDYLSQVDLPLSRQMESPMFKLADGQHYALRVATVKAETDFMVLSDLAQKAKDAGHDDMARHFEEYMKGRYGDKPIDRSKLEDTERAIAAHFNVLWERTQPKK